MKRYFSILILLLFFKSSYGQVNIDSLIIELDNATDVTNEANILYEICINILPESIDNAIIYYEKLSIVSEQINDDDFLIETLIFGGKMYRLKGDYNKALECDLKALDFAEKTEKMTSKGQILNNIGIDSYRLLSFEKALKYYFQAVDIYLLTGDSSLIGDTYNNIGMVYDEKLQTDSAIYYYNKAMEVFYSLDNKSGVADVLNNFAGMYYQRGDFDKVLEYAEKSLKIREELGDKQTIAFTLINIGAIYYSLGKFDEALEYDLSGLQIAKDIGNNPIIRYGCKNISEVYAAINDFENAYKYHIEFSVINDSIYDADKLRIMNEMQTKYETEKKEQQINLLKAESDLKESKIQRITIFWVALLVILLLILTIAIILFKQNKNKAKTNLLLETKNEKLNILNATKDKFFTIISHDLKNQLSAFCSITNSIDEYFDNIDKEVLHKNIKELSVSAFSLKELLQNLLQWAAIQNGRIKCFPTDINLNMIIENNINLLRNNACEKQIELITDLPTEINIKSDKDMLNTIFRNLLSNAIKFTNNNGFVKISAVNNNDSVVVRFEDNGIGMTQDETDKLFRIDIDTKTIGDSEEKGTGLGLILVKEMSQICNGDISVISKKDEGSIFVLKLLKV